MRKKTIFISAIALSQISPLAQAESISNKVYEIEEKVVMVERNSIKDSHQIKFLEKKALNQDEKLVELQAMVNVLESKLEEKRHGQKAPRYSFP
jgi:hypothetical protein